MTTNLTHQLTSKHAGHPLTSEYVLFEDDGDIKTLVRTRSLSRTKKEIRSLGFAIPECLCDKNQYTEELEKA